MAAVSSQIYRNLPFRQILKYGIVAFVSLVAGYSIMFSSLPPCLFETWEEHVSPNYTFTVKEYTTCYYTSISIINNKQRGITKSDGSRQSSIDYAAVNQNAYPYNKWFSCPCVTQFAGWENDSQFAVVIKNRGNKIAALLAHVVNIYLYPVSGIVSAGRGETYVGKVDAETGRIIESRSMKLL
jgi:hypothetical protein